MARPDPHPAARRPDLARALAGLAVVALCLGAWLLAPWHAPSGSAQGRPAVRLVLVDLSDSVVRRAPRFELELGRRLELEAREAQARGEELLVIGFARGVARWFGPGTGSAALERLQREGTPIPGGEVPASASDLAGAASLARELLDGRRLAALRIVSDGRWTGSDPHPLLCALEGMGAAREWLPPPAAELPDLALAGLDLPRRVAEGTPLHAVVRGAFEPGLDASAELPFELEVVLERPGYVQTWSRAGRSGPGGTWTVALALGPAERGTTKVSVRALLESGAGAGDAVPENDWAFAEVEVGDALGVAVLAGAASSAGGRAFVESVRSVPGLAPRAIEPADLAAVFAAGEVLVTFDLDPGLLPAAVLASFVRAGGAWLDLAGANTLAGWDRAAAATALAALDLRPPDLSPRDVVLLVDGSGSMARGAIESARGAARELALRAPAQERVLVRWFGAHLEPALPAADPASLAAREPGGETDVLSSLEELAAARRSLERDALVFLISDGRDQSLDAQRIAALRTQLRAARVDLRVFSVGPRADLDFLARLAAPEAPVAVESGAALEPWFARAVAGRRLRAGGPFRVRFASLDAAALGAEVSSRDALGGRELPSVDRCVRARGGAGAVVPWEFDDGEALCAVRAVGLGLTAGFASLPVAGEGAERWAPEWGERAEILGGLLRWLGSRREADPVRLSLAGRQLRIEQVPEDWPAAVRVRPVGGAGPGELLLAEAGAALDPRAQRVGPWSSGPGSVEVLDAADGALLGSFLVRGSGAPEFDAPEPAAALLQGGTEPSTAPAAPDRGPHRLGLPFLAAGLVLLAGASLAWGRS